MGFLNGALAPSQPGMITLDAQYANANYIAQDALAAGIDFYDPNVDPELTRRYGRDDLSGLLTQVAGYHKAVTGNMKYSHYEKDFIHGLLFATTAGAGANSEATFTLSADSQFDVSYNISPYTSTNVINTVVPRVFDVIQLPTTRQELVVTGVDKSAGTFTAYAVDGSVVIPALVGTEEIIVKGNTQPEFSTSMDSRTSRLLTYTNTLASHRDDFKASARGMTERSLIKDFGYSDGSKGDVWYFEGMSDTYQRFNNECEMMMLDGKQINNSGLSNTAGFETILKTEGLITTVSTSGTNVTWGANLTLSNIRSVNDSLQKYKGDKKNLWMQGYGVQKSFNGLFRNGDGVDWGKADSPARTQFGTAMGIEGMAINLDFKDVTFDGFTYYTKSINTFSDPTTLGATGQGYEDMAIILPMGDTVTYNDLNPSGSTSRVKSVRVRYKEDANGISQYYNEWYTGGFSPNGKNDENSLHFHIMGDRGFELFAPNRTAIIQK